MIFAENLTLPVQPIHSERNFLAWLKVFYRLFHISCNSLKTWNPAEHFLVKQESMQFGIFAPFAQLAPDLIDDRARYKRRQEACGEAQGPYIMHRDIIE